jgi:hypothetical protein
LKGYFKRAAYMTPKLTSVTTCRARKHRELIATAHNSWAQSDGSYFIVA